MDLAQANSISGLWNFQNRFPTLLNRAVLICCLRRSSNWIAIHPPNWGYHQFGFPIDRRVGLPDPSALAFQPEYHFVGHFVGHFVSQFAIFVPPRQA